MGVPPGVSDGRTAHLILVGLPGAGKSTLGPLVAARLGLPFVDLDREIERASGTAIAEMFARDGEPIFRRWEREVTSRLAGATPSVVAPGGGWIMQPGVAALLCPPGRILHLRVSPATAIERMGNEVALRPLLRGSDPLATLTALERERRPSYDAADAVLDTEALSLQELVSQAAALASSWGVGVG